MSAVEGSAWASENGRFFFTGGRRFHIDNQRIARLFLSQMPPRVADLLDIAMECQASDRLTTRRMGSYGLGWCRELRPVIAVRDPDFWRDPGVSGLLLGVLDWLTDDHWDPTFVSLSPGTTFAEEQGTLFELPVEGPAAVACHSGGLDSFAGAVADLGADPDLTLVLAGTSGARRARKLQERLGNDLTSISHRVLPLMVRAELVGAKGTSQDHHQRSRGLLFLSVAAAAAIVGKVSEVRMYENGIGAINLPYSDGQVGAQMSRSAHPKTLLGMQALIEAMGVGPVRFRPPQVMRTKGQMISRIPSPYAHLVGETVSCDTWASRRKSPPEGDTAVRCGHCTSCLLRRVSLRAGGYEDLDRTENYELDAFAAQPAPQELRLMLDQVARLDRALVSASPWHSLVDAFPQLVDARDALEGLGETQVEQQLVRLYETYVGEWDSVPSPLVRRYLGMPA